jgi:hypothetical protein
MPKVLKPRSRSRVTVKDVMIAAKNNDFPATLFFVAVADDKTFEQIRKLASLAFAHFQADDEATRRITIMLMNAIALSRRVQRSGA